MPALLYSEASWAAQSMIMYQDHPDAEDVSASIGLSVVKEPPAKSFTHYITQALMWSTVLEKLWVHQFIFSCLALMQIPTLVLDPSSSGSDMTGASKTPTYFDINLWLWMLLFQASWRPAPTRLLVRRWSTFSLIQMVALQCCRLMRRSSATHIELLVARSHSPQFHIKLCLMHQALWVSCRLCSTGPLRCVVLFKLQQKSAILNQ